MSDEKFDNIINPEAIKSFMSQIPGIDAYPEITALVDSPQFSDPHLLKNSVVDGVKSLRAYSDELINLLNDPQQLELLIDQLQLPPDAREAVHALLAGDVSYLKRIVDSSPGLQSSQKKMLKKLLDGDLSGVQETISNILSDPTQIQKVRQELLNNPDMLVSFGISEDSVKDDEKWQQLISDGKLNLFEQLGKEEKDSRSRKFDTEQLLA